MPSLPPSLTHSLTHSFLPSVRGSLTNSRALSINAKQRRTFCHTQRMGGISALALSRDERVILSVGQERKLTYWHLSGQEVLRQSWLDCASGDTDEGRCVAL